MLGANWRGFAGYAPAMVDRRWDTDERGTGVRDAAAFAQPVRDLLDTLGRDGWVAEDPDAHLLPHLEAATAEAGRSISSWANVDGVLEIVLRVRDEESRGARRAAAYRLVASIAEASTHVRELEPGVFEVLTGMLPGDGSFATHGHVVRIRTIAGSTPPEA